MKVSRRVVTPAGWFGLEMVEGTKTQEEEQEEAELKIRWNVWRHSQRNQTEMVWTCRGGTEEVLVGG